MNAWLEINKAKAARRDRVPLRPLVPISKSMQQHCKREHTDANEDHRALWTCFCASLAVRISIRRSPASSIRSKLWCRAPTPGTAVVYQVPAEGLAGQRRCCGDNTYYEHGLRAPPLGQGGLIPVSPPLTRLY